MSSSTTGPGAAGSSGSQPDAGWTTGWQRLSQTFLRPAGPGAGPPSSGGAPSGGQRPDVSGLTDDEKRALISTVDPKERRIGILAALLATALALGTVLPYMLSRRWVVDTSVKPTHNTCPAGFRFATSAGKAVCEVIYPASHYTLDLIVPIVLAVAIIVTIRLRRRTALAFTTMMTGLALGQIYFILPFVVGGGWIMLRAWRAQRYGAPDVKAPLPGWVPPPARGSTRRPRSTGPARSGSARKKTGATPPVRKAPSANKRYTPKTPPKKKVAPPA